MPGCSVTREVVGTTARYSVQGRFEGACAWDLCSRLEGERLGEIVVDFSQVNDFVDYGVAIVANALQGLGDKRIELRGLRQHQIRLFHYFGVDLPESPGDRAALAAAVEGPPRATGLA